MCAHLLSLITRLKEQSINPNPHVSHDETEERIENDESETKLDSEEPGKARLIKRRQRPQQRTIPEIPEGMRALILEIKRTKESGSGMTIAAAVRDVMCRAEEQGLGIIIGDTGATATLIGEMFGLSGIELSDAGLVATNQRYITADNSAAELKPLGCGNLTVGAIDAMGRFWIIHFNKVDFFSPEIVPTTLASAHYLHEQQAMKGGSAVMVHGDPAKSHIAIHDEIKNVVGRFPATCESKTYLHKLVPLTALKSYRPPIGMDPATAVVGDVVLAERVLKSKGELDEADNLLETMGLPRQKRCPGEPPMLVNLESENTIKEPRAQRTPPRSKGKAVLRHDRSQHPRHKFASRGGGVY